MIPQAQIDAISALAALHDMSVEQFVNFLLRNFSDRLESPGLSTIRIADSGIRRGNGSIISAIKAIRELTGLGLKEAKELAEAVADGHERELTISINDLVNVRGILAAGYLKLV